MNLPSGLAEKEGSGFHSPVPPTVYTRSAERERSRISVSITGVSNVRARPACKAALPRWTKYTVSNATTPMTV